MKNKKPGTASNEGRRQAIIQAMTGNHSQEVIDETAV